MWSVKQWILNMNMLQYISQTIDQSLINYFRDFHTCQNIYTPLYNLQKVSPVGVGPPIVNYRDFMARQYRQIEVIQRSVYTTSGACLLLLKILRFPKELCMMFYEYFGRDRINKENRCSFNYPACNCPAILWLMWECQFLFNQPPHLFWYLRQM